MRVDSAGQVETGVESLFLVLSVAWLTNFIRNAQFDKLDIASAEGIIDNPLVLLNCD
jgi:hypothetical protein